MASEYGQLVAHEIGHWRIVRLLGAGGFGAVYEAQHKHIAGRLAAIKVLHPQMLLRLDADDLKRRFVNEASAASRADHENIVQVFDAGVAPDGICYVVMEFLRGSSLTHATAQAGRIPIERACNIGMQVARALAAAHELAIVHRDLKPDNIFLVSRPSNPDFVKVLDFGIAKLTDSDVHTKTGQVLGTPSYMSPEQWRSARDLDGRSDLYSLGVILFECLTGRKPFVGNSLYELGNAHVSDPIPDPAAEVALPDELRALIRSLLAKNREDRPASAREVGEVLQRYLATPSLSSTRPAPLPQPSWTPPPILTSTPSDITHLVSDVRAVSSPSVPDPGVLATRRSAQRRPDRRWLLLAAIPVVGLAVLAVGKKSGQRTEKLVSQPDMAVPVGDDTTKVLTSSRLDETSLPLVPSDMVRLPAADFPIGQDQETDRIDAPQHIVHIKSFALGRFEVSLGDFRAYAEASRHGSTAPGTSLQDVASMLALPVNRVTREQAAAYCAWRYHQATTDTTQTPTRLGRLPTEEEWEYAARSMDPTAPYPWKGSEISVLHVNAGRKPAVLAVVDSFAEGATIQGIHHMIGNIAEWTSSDALPYPGGHARMKTGAIVRGGSVTSSLDAIRVTTRTIVPADTITPFLGFRCAMSLE